MPTHIWTPPEPIESLDEIWARAKGMAFWDLGKLERDKWREMFDAGNVNIVCQSINFMRPVDLIRLLGVRDFLEKWIRLREMHALSHNKRVILDAGWSYVVVGDATFRVTPCVLRYPPKKLQTLRVLLRQLDRPTIYQLAKLLGRNYRRVYDDINDFANDGIVAMESEIRNGRVCKIPQVFGIHVRFPSA